MQTVMLHMVQLVTHPSPAARQWLQFANLSSTSSHSVGSTMLSQLLFGPGKLPDERVDAVAEYLQQAPEPQTVNAEAVSPGACMLHMMEQSFATKLF